MLSDKMLEDHLDKVDYYTLLGVARDEGAARIRDGFHKFALRFHPDQHMEDPDGQRRALRIFKRGSEAYRVLLDPVLRARYDDALGRGEVRLSAEAERQETVREAHVTDEAEEPLPAEVQPLFDQAASALARGDLKNAKAFLLLVAKRSSQPKVKRLTKEILEAERARGPRR